MFSFTDKLYAIVILIVFVVSTLITVFLNESVGAALFGAGSGGFFVFIILAKKAFGEKKQ